MSNSTPGSVHRAVFILCSVLMAALAFAENPPSAPHIGVSVNGSRDADGVRGWPILVRSIVQHSRQFAANADPIDVSHGDAGWSSAVSLVLVDDQGSNVNWNFQVTASPESTLHLDGSHIGAISWRIAPEDTAKIAPGIYQLTAVLDNTDKPGQAWAGSVAAVPVSITIRDAPGTLSPNEDSRKAQLFANYYAFSGDAPSALAALDDLFTRQPDEMGSLTLRGMILESQGSNADARAAYLHALSAFQAQYPNSGEPPKYLLRLLGLLEAKLQIP